MQGVGFRLRVLGLKAKSSAFKGEGCVQQRASHAWHNQIPTHRLGRLQVGRY